MYWILIFLIGFGGGEKQKLSNSEDLDRYFKAWAYLETAGLDLAYKWSGSGKVKKKDKSTKLHVVETIQFQGIEVFERLIEKNFKETCAFDANLCLTPEIYRDRFNFSPFQLEEFNNLGSDQSSKLNLIFSKPVGKHLIANISPYKSFIGMGRIIHLLFTFDEEGSVINLHTQVRHYQ